MKESEFKSDEKVLILGKEGQSKCFLGTKFFMC